MSRSAAVGLLAAVGTAMSALVAFAHGALIWLIIAGAATAAGLAAYLASEPSKKSAHHAHEVAKKAGSIAALTKKYLVEFLMVHIYPFPA